MKKYIFGAVLSIGILASPAFTQAAALTSTQISAIVSLLQSFGADAATIANVYASLTGGTSTGGDPRPWCHTFNVDLTVGSSGDDVSALYTALERSRVYTPVPTVNPTLHVVFDEDTAGYVVRFQAKYGIRQTGYVGHITRGKLNSLYGCPPNFPPPTNISFSLSPTTVVRNQSYNFTANISGAPANSPIVFHLIRPDGSSYIGCPAGAMFSWINGEACATTNDVIKTGYSTDSSGNAVISYNVTIGNTGQDGQWNAWVSVNGIRSNKQFVNVSTVTQPSIIVLSPNGGEVWQIGSQRMVYWNTNANKVNVMLRRESAPQTVYQVMANSPTEAGGSYVWTIPTYLVPGNDYKILVNVPDSSGNANVAWDFSDGSFSIVAPTTATTVPTVEFIDTPTLGLQTDSAGQEAYLVGKATVKVMAGNSPLDITNLTSILWLANTSLNASPSPRNVESSSTGSIPANTSATVTLTLTAPTKVLFAGAYTMGVTFFGYYDTNGVWQAVLPSSFKNISTHLQNSNTLISGINPVTIIGETSPYISSVSCAADSINCLIRGVRFGATNTVSLNGITKSIGGLPSIDPITGKQDVIWLNIRPADFGITTSGYYPVQIINSSTGNSNLVTLNYTAPTTTGATPITLSSITPSSGPVGTNIRLDGCGSDSTSGFTLVYSGPKSGTASIPVETLGAASGCGYMTITVPSDFPAGTYTLSVKNNQTGVMSTNSVAFTVTVPAQTITVLSPNGGETLTKGTTTNIRWSGGTYPVQVGIVRATYPADTTVMGWINVGANANGTLGWDTNHIGPLDYLTSGQTWSIDPGQYKVLLVSTAANGNQCFGSAGCVYDTSDSAFTITAPIVTNTSVTLSSITPSSGPVGTSIRLDGCGSDSTSGFTLVYTGPKSGTASIPVETLGAASGCGYMIIAVPSDFPAGAYTLSVKNNQTGAMSTNSVAFTVTAPAQTITISRTPGTSLASPFKVGDATVSSSVNTPSLFASNLTGTGYNQIGTNAPRTFTFSTFDLVNSGACNATTGICNIPGNWDAASLACPAGMGAGTTQYMTEWYTIGNVTSNKLNWYFKCSGTVAAMGVYTNPGLASALGSFGGATNSVSQAPATIFTYVWNRDLQIGSPYQGDVIALQQALTREGVYTGEITGGFYNQTYAAVKAFQAKYGIDATGYVGLITRTKLNTLY